MKHILKAAPTGWICTRCQASFGEDATAEDMGQDCDSSAGRRHGVITGFRVTDIRITGEWIEGHLPPMGDHYFTWRHPATPTEPDEPPKTPTHLPFSVGSRSTSFVNRDEFTSQETSAQQKGDKLADEWEKG